MLSISEFLKNVPLFAGLSERDLQTISDAAETLQLQAGQPLFADGDPGDRAYVVKEGQLEVFKQAGGRETLLSSPGPGAVIGEMAILENAPRMAGVRARSDTTLIAIGKDDFDRMVATSHSAARVIFRTVLERWRATESVLRHSERMAQLGVLTAGVAHEMNNPAAAIKRSSDQMADSVRNYATACRLMAAAALTVEQIATVERLESRVAAIAPGSTLSPLERSDREGELEDWLAGHGIEEPWELSSSLTDGGFRADELTGDLETFEPAQAEAVLRYLVSARDMHNLVNEVRIGAGRLSEIVKALKGYSFLDQAPVQNVDVHEGIDNTLIILGSKLKQGVVVRRDYAPDLPMIEAYGSELNQVWTNLIDNAVDAMNGKGELVIRSKRMEKGIGVEVEDTGPGIPEKIKSRIFDAFFTTKPPGKGTGLGLNVTYNIVVHRHRGSIEADSAPGRTTFRVWLPLSLTGSKPGGR